MIRSVLPFLVLFALVAPLAAQQQPDPSSPEAAALAYIDAMKGARLDSMAAMMHPESLAAFRGVLQPVLEAADRSEGGAGEVLQLFDGIGSVAQLKQLTDAKFYAAFYGGILALEPELLETIRSAETDVLGHVVEGDDTAHVLYRMRVQAGASMRKTDVVSLRRMKSSWGILLSPEIEGMADGIRQSFEMRH